MDLHHLAKFPSDHIPYKRHPPSALFPLQAVLIGRGSQRTVWLVYDQPHDPVCLQMNICLMPSSNFGSPSTCGIVHALWDIRDGWALFDIHTASESIVLCVPEGWACGKKEISIHSWIREWWRPPWLLEISPEIFSAVFTAVRGGMLHGVTQCLSNPRSSTDTVKPMERIRSSTETVRPPITVLSSTYGMCACVVRSSAETIRPTAVVNIGGSSKGMTDFVLTSSHQF